MRTDAYWSQRMEMLNEAQLQKGEEYIRSMQREYDKAMTSIQRDIDVFYQRFAENNRVNLAAARQMLSAGQLQEFKWTVEEYIQRGRENAIDQRWMRQLENASIKVRVSRLEALQTQMQQHVEVLHSNRQAGSQRLLGGIYQDNYYRSIFEVQKGTGIGSSFSKLDTAQIEKVLSAPWAPDGSNFTSRIWKDKQKLLAELKTTLTQSLIRGDPSDRVIRDFAQRMDVSQSAARRLILTESAYFAGQSRLDSYKEMSVEKYKYTATLDTRTSNACRHMDGQVILVAEAQPGENYPPLHGHCRSTTIPYFEDNVKERAARDRNGDVYAVDGNMTYKEWHEKHVGKEALLPSQADVQDSPPTGGADSVKLVEQLPATASLEEKVRQLKRYEEVIRNEPIEHAYILSESGEVYHTSGTSREVNIAAVGADKLKDSIVTHNHPSAVGEPGGSFSREDVLAFVAFGLQELRAVDSKHTYQMRRTSGLSVGVDEISNLLQVAEMSYKAKLTIQDLLNGYDEKHLTMLELAAVVDGLLYEREVAPVDKKS